MRIETYKVRGETRYKFRAYVGLDPGTGKPIRVMQSGFETKKEAQLAYAELVAKAQPMKARGITYGRIYDIWQDTYRLTVKDSTLRHTKQIFKDHILPAFGSMKVKDITPLMCQNFANSQTQISACAGERYNYFSKILDFAVKQGVIDRNPAALAEWPRRRQPEAKRNRINYYTKEELELFLERAEDRLPHMWYVFFRLLAYTGMRRGEALALTWNDLDEPASTISVTKTLTRGSSGVYISPSPKTDRSNRTILIDRETLRLLLTLDRVGEYIFTNSKGTYITPSQPIRQMHKVVDGTDLRYISPHGLRHTHCSMLFSAGVSIPEVQDRLGHANVKTTIDVYNHVYQQDKQKALDRFMEYMAE